MYNTGSRDNTDNIVSSYGSQAIENASMSRTPLTNSLQPRNQIAYPYPPNISRNQLTESEPLSPYSEMQIPMTPMRQINQMNLMRDFNFGFQEPVIQPQLGAYPLMAMNNIQTMKNKRTVDARPQKMELNGISTFPYTRNSFKPQSQLMLLPTPMQQQCISAHTPKYKSHQPQAVHQSTPLNTSGRNLCLTDRAKKEEAVDISKMDRSTTIAQDDKQNGSNRTRFLIGTIDQIVNWNLMSKKGDLKIIYEVTGILDSISYSFKGRHYKIILRDNQHCNSVLYAVYFPIDGDIAPQISLGELITFTGIMRGARKLQVLNMWPTKSNSLAGLKRISFLCQRTLQEACLSTNEP